QEVVEHGRPTKGRSLTLNGHHPLNGTRPPRRSWSPGGAPPLITGAFRPCPCPCPYAVAAVDAGPRRTPAAWPLGRSVAPRRWRRARRRRDPDRWAPLPPFGPLTPVAAPHPGAWRAPPGGRWRPGGWWRRERWTERPPAGGAG